MVSDGEEKKGWEEKKSHQQILERFSHVIYKQRWPRRL